MALDLAKAVFQLLFSCAGQELNRLGELKDNIKSLDKAMGALREKKSAIQERVDSCEKHQHLVRTREVAEWLLEVENLERTVQGLQGEYPDENSGEIVRNRFDLGYWWSAFRLGSRVTVLLSEAGYLKKKEFKVIAGVPRQIS